MIKFVFLLAVTATLAGCSEPQETKVDSPQVALSQGRAQPQQWVYGTGSNPVTRSSVVFGGLYSEPTIDGSQYKLVVRAETPGVVEVFLYLTIPFVCQASETGVTISFDGGAGQRIACQPSTTGAAPSVFGPNNRQLVNRMADAETMTVTIHQVERPDRAVTFHPKGFTFTPENAPAWSDVSKSW